MAKATKKNQTEVLEEAQTLQVWNFPKLGFKCKAASYEDACRLKDEAMIVRSQGASVKAEEAEESVL